MDTRYLIKNANTVAHSIGDYNNIFETIIKAIVKYTNKVRYLDLIEVFKKINVKNEKTNIENEFIELVILNGKQYYCSTEEYEI